MRREITGSHSMDLAKLLGTFAVCPHETLTRMWDNHVTCNTVDALAPIARDSVGRWVWVTCIQLSLVTEHSLKARGELHVFFA